MPEVVARFDRVEPATGPEERGKGIGRNCVSALGRIFLERTQAIYLFVEQQNTRTQEFYLNLGFSVGGQYDLLYV